MTALPLKLLLIEDSENDVFFLVRQLKAHGFDIDYTRIETAAELHACLSSDHWDIIITDHTLPEFNSIEAISIINQLNKDIPLIVLSGTIDQSIAIESMRLGACDFIMKDETSRLIPAIERELQAAKSRRQQSLSEARYKRDLQGIMNHSPAFISIKDLQGIYTFINKRGEQMLNMDRQEILGKTDYELFDTKEADKLHCNDTKVLKSATALETEENIKFNNQFYTFNSVKYPLIDESGNIYAICSISTDITEKKQQAEKLRRSQKMEAIGQLTGGIAHDFNNQLGIISGYLEFLIDHLSHDEQLLKWVKTANKATFRCVDLTRQLLDFSRRSPNKTNITNINNVFFEFSDMIQRTLTPQIEVDFHMSDNLWHTEIDIGEFQDVILNFVINARDAMPDGGKLLIETKNKVHTEKPDVIGSNIKPGDYIQLIISDTGVGMDAQTLDRIFEPFYTTKPTGMGTGLGLSMIYGFVHRYDGDISVYSELGIGTTFRLSLPRTDGNQHKPLEAENIQSLPKGNESVLIVDDEPELLQLANVYLSDLGYQTYTANNATQALDILKNNKSINILFSDVVMPGEINGYQLAHAAIKLIPELKLLMTSGFTSKSIESHNLVLFKKPLLNKPYTKAELALSIRDVLNM